MNPIYLYNTLVNKKELFIPLEENKVKMYVCGPTVYNYIHIGNARPAVVFDSVRRFLEYRGYDVNYVSNFTDIDDKIINVANELGVDYKEVSEKFIEAYLTDLSDLGCKKASFNPKVSDNINNIIDFISVLINKGFAYKSNDGVYFRSSDFSSYGKLSNQNLNELLEGVRIDSNVNKESNSDFVLWKFAKANEPSWFSPWGAGRPGWHIECSVMAREHLGDTIDIHAGGIDLMFPHHENEIAQSEAHNDKTFANYWLHNGHIMVDDVKMSKSLNNFLLVNDIKKEFDVRVLRLFLLSVHYRSPMNYSVSNLVEIETSFKRLLNNLNSLNLVYDFSSESLDSDEKYLNELDNFVSSLDNNMSNDFNTASSIATLFELSRFLNIYINDNNFSKVVFDKFKDVLSIFSFVLGLDLNQNNLIADEYLLLILEREEARKSKNYARSDEIRDSLLSKDVILEDTRYGVRWSYK